MEANSQMAEATPEMAAVNPEVAEATSEAAEVNPQVAEVIQKVESKAVFWVKFRSELFNRIQKDTGDEEKFLKQFYLLNSNAARVDLFYDALKKYNLLDNKFKPDAKSDRLAKINLRKGANTFVRNQIAKSLRHNTYCIMKAQDPNILAEAYANRSAALMRYRMYDEALEDIERAVEHDYPKEKMPSLQNRKRTIKKLGKSYLKPNFYEPPHHIPRNQQNPHFPSATRLVDVQTDGTKHSRVVATKDIDAGQVLAVEDCIGFSLLTSASIFHCHQCFELTYNPIPCPTCTQVVFCGKNCKDRAFSTFHKHECALLKTMRHIADEYRTFLTALRITFCLEEEPDQNEAKQLDAMAKSVDWDAVNDEVLTVSMMAALIYHLVKNHTTRFLDRSDDDSFKERLVLNLLICFTQSSIIDEYHPDTEETPQSILRMRYTSQVVASGLYFFYSKFRHSCAPNVHKFHHGTRRVLRALRTIKKGEECFVSFGPYYEYHSKERRQDDLLTSRHFTCKCRACEKNWVLDKREDYLLKHPNDAIGVRVIAPGKPHDIKLLIGAFLYRLKEYEGIEPDANLCAITDIVLYCYAMYGNKREII